MGRREAGGCGSCSSAGAGAGSCGVARPRAGAASGGLGPTGVLTDGTLAAVVSPAPPPIARVYYRVAVHDLLARLAADPGLYRGRGDGPETGPFVARIDVSTVVRGRAVTLDYEAVNDRNGLQHVEHTVLVTGEGGRLELHVACLELPGVVRFVETGPGEFTAYDGPTPARIVVGTPAPGTLTYGWWWARDEAQPREQSRAEVRRTG